MPKTPNKKVEEEVGIRIVEHTSFTLTKPQNVERVTMALAMSGYLVSIINVSDAYVVNIYKRV